MKQNNYRALLYFIVITIGITIAIQFYWNIQNFNSNKQRLINEVQISLDNGVEAYYANLAKTDFFAFVRDSSETLNLNHDTFWDALSTDSTFLEIHKTEDSLGVFTGIKGFTQLLDSNSAITAMRSSPPRSVSVFRGKHAVDSLQKLPSLVNDSVQGLASLTSRIIVSITRDSIDFAKLDTLLKEEFERKDIAISYALKHFENNKEIQSFSESNSASLALSTFAKSTYLPDSQKLQLFFSNPTLTILKRSLMGIGLSLLLSICIIACLLYLLYTIKKQKALAEIKNDLISNITHEFKTPIATVATAIEGIKSFNANNDQAKTDSYLDISQQQLKKLHLMVEKLLETSTLDSDKLIIIKEEIDVVLMLESLVDRYQMLAQEKEILFKTNENGLLIQVDPFHFENAIANIIDNAVKYGGTLIEVNLNSRLNSFEITIADNGGKIDKNQRVKIFDKFYRIPTGNRHDVKGFGIGLFYSKKIIDKHGGQLTLEPDPDNTVFKIRL